MLKQIQDMQEGGPDDVRAAFDAWYLEYRAQGGSGDDVYKIARDYQKYIKGLK